MDVYILPLKEHQINLLNRIVREKDGLIVDNVYLVTAEILEKRGLIKWTEDSGIKRAKITKLGARHVLHYLDVSDTINLLEFPPFGK